MRLAARARRIRPSPTLEITARAQLLRAQGRDVISLAAGEPDFDTPPNVKEAAVRALREGRTKYTPAPGIPELREAIAQRYREEFGLDYEPSEVIVGCGAKHVLFNALQVLLEEGDEALVVAPYWVSYPAMVALAGGQVRVVWAAEEDGFKLRPEALQEAIGRRTRLLILNNPCNPTGAVYSPEELEALAEVVLRHGLVVISDEVYERFVYEGRFVSLAALDPALQRRTVVVSGVSKSYAMTGWRIGYALGPEEVIRAMAALQSQSTSNPNSIAQWAALEALRGPQDHVQRMIAAFAERRRAVVEALNRMPAVRCLPPQGAFYAFPRVELEMGSVELAELLLERAGVALVPGAAFGAEGYLRLSYSVDMERLQEALRRLGRALEELA